MDFNINSSESALVVTLRGEKRKLALVHLLAAGVLFAAAHFLLYQNKARFCGELFGAFWALFVALRQQFGTSVLTITTDTVSLNRHILGTGRTRSFPRSDVERLGYEPQAGQDDAALALMVRTVMMPLRFAHGITPAEAEHAFSALKSAQSWIAGQIRPVGTPVF